MILFQVAFTEIKKQLLEEEHLAENVVEEIFSEILNHIGLTVFCLEWWRHNGKRSLTTEGQGSL